MGVTQQQLLDYLQDNLHLDASEIELDTPLFSGGILDSFAMVDLVMYLETQGAFKMSPSEVNLDNLDSLQKILQFVEAKRAC